MISIEGLEKVSGPKKDFDHILQNFKYVLEKPKIGERVVFYLSEENYCQRLLTSPVNYIEQEDFDVRFETKNSIYKFKITEEIK